MNLNLYKTSPLCDNSRAVSMNTVDYRFTTCFISVVRLKRGDGIEQTEWCEGN